MKQRVTAQSNILQIYSQWIDLWNKAEESTPAHIAMGDQVAWFEESFTNPMEKLADEAMRLACVTPADFAAKMLMRTCSGEAMDCITCLDLIEEAKSLVSSQDGGGELSARPLPV